MSNVSLMQADPRAYALAPVVAPTVHVAASIGWQVLAGRPELAVATAAWQAIAWFLLVPVVLATHPIALRVFRAPLLKLAQSLQPPLAWAASVAAALVASYALVAFRMPVASWFAALASSAFAFSALCSHFPCSASENRANPSFKRTPDGAA